MDKMGVRGGIRKEEGTAATLTRSAKSLLAIAKHDRCHSQIALISRKIKEEHDHRRLNFANSEEQRTSWLHLWRMFW